MDALANFDRLAMNEQIVNAIDNVIAHEDAAVGTNVETNNVPYVGPTYDRDPYETDTDQSIDGGSDDLDIDGNIIPMPMRTLNANELDELLDDEIVNERVLNEALAWRDAMQMIMNMNARPFFERKTIEDVDDASDGDDDASAYELSDEKFDDESEMGNVVTPTTLDEITGKEFWIGNTGATTHLTNCDEGMVNTRMPARRENLVMGNGTSASANAIGDLLGTACDKDGNKLQKIKLQEVTYAKNAKFNLFSVSAMIKKGWKLEGDKNELKLMKDGRKVVFDIKINTPKGVLFCMNIKHNRNEEAANLNADEEAKAKTYIDKALDVKKVDINKAHEILGHMGKENTRNICKYLGMV